MSGRRDDDGKSQWSTQAQEGGYEAEEEGEQAELETARFTRQIEGAEKRVLAKGGTSTMNRARQMFLLDQLKKPTPTPTPEGQDGPRMSRSDSFGSVESASRFTRGQNRRTEGGAPKQQEKAKEVSPKKAQKTKPKPKPKPQQRKGRVKSRTNAKGRAHGSREEKNELRGSVGRLTQTNRGE